MVKVDGHLLTIEGQKPSVVYSMLRKKIIRGHKNYSSVAKLNTNTVLLVTVTYGEQRRIHSRTVVLHIEKVI